MTLVLLIEDDDVIREVLSEALIDVGFEVGTAHNGREALELLASAPRLPEVILLDLMMPVMNGWEFRQAQLEDVRLSSIPIVIVTADAAAHEAAAELNAAGLIKKPAKLEAIVGALNAASSHAAVQR